MILRMIECGVFVACLWTITGNVRHAGHGETECTQQAWQLARVAEQYGSLSLSRLLLLQAAGSAQRWSPGLVNFDAALAYHFCLALPAAFSQPRDHLLAEPCSAHCTSSYHLALVCPQN